MRLFSNTKIDFLGSRRVAAWLSAAIIIPGLVLIPVFGINYSVEFTGGTQVRIRTIEPGDVSAMRQALTDNGVTSAERPAPRLFRLASIPNSSFGHGLPLRVPMPTTHRLPSRR